MHRALPMTLQTLPDPGPPLPSPSGGRLLADIGGTNARFAWQDTAGAPLGHVQVLPAAGFPSLLDAIRHYLHGLDRGAPMAAAVGIANPVDGDAVRMTNHAWSFSIAELQGALGLSRLVVMNDFEALARALPLLEPDETRCIGGSAATPRAPIGLIGPGTGLGVSALVPHGAAGWQPLATEGGHVTLAAQTARENAVLAVLRRRFGHVSAERVVSGPGLVELYRTLCELDGVPSPDRLAARDLTAPPLPAALDPVRADEAIELFLGFLGSTAGNLALTLGARGGVFIGGGIVPRLTAQRLERSALHARFVGKGRFEPWLRPIPLRLITSDRHPALRGAAQALDDDAQREHGSGPA